VPHVLLKFAIAVEAEGLCKSNNSCRTCTYAFAELGRRSERRKGRIFGHIFPMVSCTMVTCSTC
jgi:hypothetical protein